MIIGVPALTDYINADESYDVDGPSISATCDDRCTVLVNTASLNAILAGTKWAAWFRLVVEHVMDPG